jgi:cyclic-di-AMP phosphodiesterase PgpH
MKKFLEKIRNNHNLFYVIFLFAICLAVLLYLYPQAPQFRYEFSEGRPWQHEDLFAPFDFDVHLTAKEVEAENQRILQNVIPVYKRLHEVENKEHEQLKNLIRVNWEAHKTSGLGVLFQSEERDSVRMERHVEKGIEVLGAAYHKGIIQLAEQHDAEREDFEVSVMDGVVGVTVPLSDLLTIKEADTFVKEHLKEATRVDKGWLIEQVRGCLEFNIVYDPDQTARFVQGEVTSLQRTMARVKAGERLMTKGELVDGDKYRMLNSLRQTYAGIIGVDQSWYIILLGQTMLLGLCLLSVAILLRFFRPDVLEEPAKVAFILVLLVLMVLMTKFTIEIDSLHVYLAPLCILPIIIRAFYDVKMALFLHMISVFMISFMVPNPFEFVFLQIFAGILLQVGISSFRKRSQFFFSALFIFLSYAVTYFGINIIQEGSFEQIRWSLYAWFGGNALLSLMAYPLIFLFEKSFGFLSEVSLLEISDANNSLLRELNEHAPGTFQHSLQVANLAEEAISAIGGNSLLVRAGALYHDIGKMKNPRYFTENQHGNNPHDDLPYNESARIIIDHVINGVELAKKHRLPEEIIDFIRTHHGTTRPEYFWRMYVKDLGYTPEDDSAFRYPGPLPYSRETAVLMMADGVEAASRSLKHYDEKSIEGLIDSIFNHLMDANQFIHANITFKEITEIKRIFKRKLMNIYHSRIEYPK